MQKIICIIIVLVSLLTFDNYLLTFDNYSQSKIQYKINTGPLIKHDGEIININGHDFTLMGVNLTSQYAVFRDEGLNYHEVYKDHIKIFSAYNVAIAIDNIWGVGVNQQYASFYGCHENIDGPDYINYSITSAPNQVIDFEATITGKEFIDLKEDYEVYTLGETENIVINWFTEITRFNGNHSIKFFFTIPDNAIIGSYNFYLLTKYDGYEERHFTKLTISVLVDIEDNGNPNNQNILLHQNYPNPFNPCTTIEFVLPERQYTTLTIYNTIGQEVSKLVSKVLQAGGHKVVWNADQYPTGLYFYRLQAGEFVQTKKLLLMK